jgi:hypothetical protein
MTSSGGDWVAVPIPGQPDRWDWVPAEQPPSPDGTPGTWHVAGGTGPNAGTWEWFPAAGAPSAPPPSAAPPLPWETGSAPSAATGTPAAEIPAAEIPAADTPAADTPAAAIPAATGPVGPNPWQPAASSPAVPGQQPTPGWQAAPPVAVPRSRRSWKVPLIIGAVVVVLAAAGGVAAVVLSGDDEGKKKDAITELANYVVTVDNGKDVCSSHLTTEFVQNVFGSIETCEKDDEDSDSDSDATGATVTNFSFDGDHATATVTVNGGETDGATGTWAFAQDDSDTWRVSEWRADYLRSSFQKGFGDNYKADGPDDPFADADLRGCVTQQALQLDDPGFLDFAHQQFRDSDEATKQMLGFMAECPSDTEGVSALRALFETGFRQNMASQQVPPTIVDCIVNGLRTNLSDDDIKELSINGDQPHPDINSRVQQTTVACAGGSSSAPQTVAPPAPSLDDPGFGI